MVRFQGMDLTEGIQFFLVGGGDGRASLADLAIDVLHHGQHGLEAYSLGLGVGAGGERGWQPKGGSILDGEGQR